jgi:hypothetical protein
MILLSFFAGLIVGVIIGGILVAVKFFTIRS